jgi:lipopolysaccharide biosynthesis glycosyltransferase
VAHSAAAAGLRETGLHVHIVCATDSNYAEYAGVLLRTIAVNGDVPDARIVVCGDGLSARDKAWISQSGSGLNISFLDIEGAARARIAHLPKMAYWTQAAFIRLLVPDLLPDVTGKVLFLDVDMMVNRSLRALLETDLDSAVLAAVPNAGDPDVLARLNRVVGRPSDQPYFNSGTLLIDLDRWRVRDLTERCLDFLTLSPAISYPDQDALNAVIGEDLKVLPRTWNFWASQPMNLTHQDYAAAHIVHFIGRIKPNMVESRHPAKELYLAHRANTPWRDEPLMTRQYYGWRGLLMPLLQRLYARRPKLRTATERDVRRARSLRYKR